MVLALPLIVCIVGLLIYILSATPKIAEVGRLMFWVGLLAMLLGAGPYVSELVVRGH